MKHVPPALTETAFNCPHCGALTTQFWNSVYAEPLGKGNTPRVLDQDQAAALDFSNVEDEDERQRLDRFARRIAIGSPFIYGERCTADYTAANLHISRCYNCDEIAVWVRDNLLYPRQGEAPAANPDLPADIRRDYDEASSILDLSPRGAAALLRLGIQKLCKELGEPGKNINDDIKSLVAKGLDPRLQKALDAVRVIGNEAVHPGELDLRDDRATAETLFRLLNLIAEKMISEPKHVDEVYAALPAAKRDAIERRDRREDDT